MIEFNRGGLYMKEYLTNQIRNVAILGHLGSGKTSLVESMLYISKAINKKGEVERKNTVSDYLVEEQNRQTSLSTSLIPVEWNNYKINFLDTPGSEEFVGEIEQDLAVVKGAVILLDAQKGVEVGTERVWDELRIRHTPTILFINKIDKENVKFLSGFCVAARTSILPGPSPSSPAARGGSFCLLYTSDAADD